MSKNSSKYGHLAMSGKPKADDVKPKVARPMTALMKTTPHARHQTAVYGK